MSVILFLQLSVLMGWHLLKGVRMTWVVSIELLLSVKKVPCEKFSRSCQILLLTRPSMKSYPLQTDVFYVFCIIPGTSQLLSIWCCSHLLPVHEVCPSIYLCTVYYHPHGTRWGMSPIIIFMAILKVRYVKTTLISSIKMAKKSDAFNVWWH